MTAAGMSMHMAMMNAKASKAALDQKSGVDKTGKGDIWLSDEEIKELRKESGKSETRNLDDVPPEYKEDDDINPLPKCSFCCIIM